MEIRRRNFLVNKHFLSTSPSLLLCSDLLKLTATIPMFTSPDSDTEGNQAYHFAHPHLRTKYEINNTRLSWDEEHQRKLEKSMQSSMEERKPLYFK